MLKTWIHEGCIRVIGSNSVQLLMAAQDSHELSFRLHLYAATAWFEDMNQMQHLRYREHSFLFSAFGASVAVDA
jgi:hypothetical protein